MKRLDKNKEVLSFVITPVMTKLRSIDFVYENSVAENKAIISKIQTFLNERGYCCAIDGLLTEETIKAFITRVNDCAVYDVKSDVLYPKVKDLDLANTSIGYLAKLCNYIIPNLGLNPAILPSSDLLLAVNDALDFELFKGELNGN